MLLFKLLGRLGNVVPPFHLVHWKWFRFILLVFLDVLVLLGAYWGAFVLRLDDFTIAEYRAVFLSTTPWVVIIHISVFVAFGMYRQVWRYANYNSALLIGRCMLAGTLASVMAQYLLSPERMPPRSVPFIFFLLATALVTLVKFAWRAWAVLQASVESDKKERCLIYGAGSAGDLLARHIIANPRFPYTAVGFIDDDRNKRGRLIHGLKIFGTGEHLVELARDNDVQTVLLAMHSPPGKVIRDIVKRCHEARLKPLIMPDIAHSLGQNVIQPRAIDIKDLLRRSPKSIDHERVRLLFQGKTVLVTGAGGSIGSEICRQVMDYKPKALVLLDASEFNLYSIDTELRDRGIEGIEIHPILGSVVDPRTVRRVFQDYRPSLVLHAAAYKHVPMVESNPMEGVINNLLGTKNVVDAAIAFKTERFLMVSSDKAVRPTNVMGMTKRACEMLVQAHAAQDPEGPIFCATRFGNVLGSSGSVIPRFLQQIQAGGPVTVTHTDVTRFFMLASEAVGLVLQSITMATHGKIFVLNMGEPVKIYDMAHELIRLVGKEPGKDIEVIVTGLRPGEKLFEELILEGAEQHTVHDDVFVATARTPNPKDTFDTISRIISLAQEGSSESCLRLLRSLAGYMTASPGDLGEGESPRNSVH